MLSPRIGLLLGSEELEILAESLTGLDGIDDVIDETALGSHKRIGEVVRVLGDVLLDVLATEDDLDGTLGTHDGDLTVGPGVVGITTKVLGGHDAVGTTITLTGDDGDLGDGGLGVGVDELGTLTNDTSVLLVDTGQESGDINEGDERNVEGIAEADETSTLDGGVDIEAAGLLERLVGDDTNGSALHATETNDEVLGEVGGGLEEVVVIDDHVDDLLHIVGELGVGGDDLLEGDIGTVARIVALADGDAVLVVERKEVVESSHGAEHLDIVVVGALGDAGLGGVDLGATELLLGDLLTGDGLDYVGTGDEHVGGIADHEDEIGDGGGVDGTTGAGTHDEGDLGDDTGGEGVALEDLGVTGEGVAALLDTGTAGVIETDDGSADGHGLVHDLADLLGVGEGEGAAEDGEVLGVDEDETAVDGTVAGDDTVARVVLLLHTEVGATVGLELVVLAEGALIEEELETLTGGELAAGVLGVDSLLTTTEESLLAGLGESLSERLLEVDGSGEGAGLRHRAGAPVDRQSVTPSELRAPGG